MSQRRTRRYFLQCLSIGTGGVLLAACSPAPPAPAAQAPAAAPAAASPAAAAPAPAPAAAPSAAAAPAAPVASPAAAAAAAGTTGGTLNFASDGLPGPLDPNYSAQRGDQIIFFQIYDCLLARGKDNVFKPWLATGWEVSPDGKSYTFKLRTDVKFHDGTPLNAEAVKFNFDRAHSEKLASIMIGSGGAAGFYDSADVVDANTVRINLNRPWAPFLDAVSYLYRIVSPAAAQKFAENFGRNPVGSGPFKFVSWNGNDITLERNPDYRWPAPYYKNQGPALLDRIVFKYIPEAGTRSAVLEKGEAEVAMTLPAQDAVRLKADPKFQLLVGRTPGVPFAFAINSTKPPTDELAVRQALNEGIDRDAICNIVFGPYQALSANTPAYAPLAPGTFGYDKSAELYRYDAAKAKQLLDDAGWKPGGDGIRTKAGQPLEVILGTWEPQGVADVAQAQLRDAGIDLKIVISPALTVNENQRKGESHMSPLPGARSDPSILNNWVHSRSIGTWGFTFQKDPQLDDLLDRADAEVDEKKRLELWLQADKTIMERALFLPIYNRDNIVAASARVQGLEFERGFYPWLGDVSIKA